MSRRLDRLERHKHAVLLAALTITSLLQPLAHGFAGGVLLFDVLVTALLLVVFAVVFQPGAPRSLALLLAMPALLGRFVRGSLPLAWQTSVDVAHRTAAIVFLGFAVAIILRGVFHERTIRIDQIFGTICGYLLAGLMWGNAYGVADLLVPGAFAVHPDIQWQLPDAHLHQSLLNYYSLCTLTSLGYNDVTAIHPVSEALTWMETVFGQFYLAVVVSQLIGLKLAQPAAPAAIGPAAPIEKQL